MKSEVYLQDCIEGMKQYPDKHFELAVVDPPYGMPKGSTHGRGKLKNRILNNGGVERWDDKPTEQYFNELFRVSVNQIIWGGNYFHLPPSRCIVCWDKCQPWENFSQIELAWTSFDSVARLFKFDNRTGDKIHPTQKPVALYDWIFKNYAKEGGKVLDTHGGSMSSLIAAIRAENIEMTVFEIDKDYFNESKKRVQDFLKQKDAFRKEHEVIFVG